MTIPFEYDKNGSFTPQHQMIAVLRATGKNCAEISRETGIPYTTVLKRARHDLFPVYLEKYTAIFCEQRLAHEAEIASRFDGEVGAAFDTLVELHRGAEAETVRRGAATDILDRAPAAPKVVKNAIVNDNRTVIQFPVEIVEQMGMALRLAGQEVIEVESVDEAAASRDADETRRQL